MDSLSLKTVVKSLISSPDQKAQREEVHPLLQCYSYCVWPDSAGTEEILLSGCAQRPSLEEQRQKKHKKNTNSHLSVFVLQWVSHH